MPVFAAGPLAAREPELKVRRARRRPNRLGFAVPAQFRLSVTAYPGIRPGDALETLLHELVHLHVGRAAEAHAWHGKTFKGTLALAMVEASRAPPLSRLMPMSDYAIKNLMEIEDGTGVEGIEGRFSREFLDSEQLGISHFRYAPERRVTHGHRHEVQEEAYVVVGGSGRIKLDDETIELRQWDVVRVAPHVVRGFETGPDGLEVIAIGGTKPEGGDGELVADRWPDADG
jgi:quercetin dioxygenase-like cupin family protein